VIILTFYFGVGGVLTPYTPPVTALRLEVCVENGNSGFPFFPWDGGNHRGHGNEHEHDVA